MKGAAARPRNSVASPMAPPPSSSWRSATTTRLRRRRSPDQRALRLLRRGLGLCLRLFLLLLLPLADLMLQLLQSLSSVAAVKLAVRVRAAPLSHLLQQWLSTLGFLALRPLAPLPMATRPLRRGSRLPVVGGAWRCCFYSLFGSGSSPCCHCLAAWALFFYTAPALPQ